MDLMFEDEVDEVGSDVEGYCTKCKADTTHVVISKYEDEIRRVQCNVCGDVHSFRKPRGEVEDEVPEPVSARKRALMKKPTWEEFFAKHKASAAKPYQFRLEYNEQAIVEHPKFGVGFVSEVVSNSKVEITFKDGRRILVHNRGDIPGLPTGDGTPSDQEPPAKGKSAAKAAPKAPVKADKAKSAPEKVVKPPKLQPDRAVSPEPLDDDGDSDEGSPAVTPATKSKARDGKDKDGKDKTEAKTPDRKSVV